MRAGERYILVTTAAALSPGAHVHSVQIACRGISGVLIEVPDAIDSDLEDRLRRIGLSPAKSIEVWPAGLAAVTWDGEGHGEWLASERACLGIRSDHEIASLVVSMNTGVDMPLELTSINAGQTIFVELPPLPVGLHKVPYTTRDQSGAIRAAWYLDVMMRVREARPWSPAASPHGPLLVQIDPPTRLLSNCGRDTLRSSIVGPSGRQVRCRASLSRQRGVHLSPRFTCHLFRCRLTETNGRGISSNTFAESPRSRARMTRRELARSTLPPRSWARSRYVASANSRRSGGLCGALEINYLATDRRQWRRPGPAMVAY